MGRGFVPSVTRWVRSSPPGADDADVDDVAGCEGVEDTRRGPRRRRSRSPSISTITSPSRMPASAAGPFASVARTSAPCSTGRSSWNARSDVTLRVEMPRYAVGSQRVRDRRTDRRLHGVDRDREADVLGVVAARGVDPHHATRHVDQRPAGVPVVDRRVRLDHLAVGADAVRADRALRVLHLGSSGRARRRCPPSPRVPLRAPGRSRSRRPAGRAGGRCSSRSRSSGARRRRPSGPRGRARNRRRSPGRRTASACPRR